MMYVHIVVCCIFLFCYCAVFFQLDSSSNFSGAAVISQLLLTVLVPIILGQIVRSQARQKLLRMRLPYGTISRLAHVPFINGCFIMKRSAPNN